MLQGAREQLDTLVGNRVETLSIRGTQSGASGGTYVSNINDSEFDIFKVTGRSDFGGRQPIGDSGVGWNLVVEGGVGQGTFSTRSTRISSRATRARSTLPRRPWG